MSLGSLPHFSTALFGALRSIDGASEVTDIPVIVTATSLICLCVFLQFEYNNGIIATHVLLEAPSQVESLEAEKNDPTQYNNKGRTYLRERALSYAKSVLLPTLAFFTGLELAWRAGFIKMNPQRELGGIVGIVVCSVSNILRPSNSVAATVKQSLARHRLSRTRFVSTGLEIFIPYVATSLAGMYFISNLSLPYYMVSKMGLGLVLTSIHTAWVHTVISNTEMSLWQRIPGGRDWIALIPAASLDIALPDAVYGLTKGTLVYFQDPAPGEELSSTVFFFSAIAPVTLSWLTATVTNAVYTKVAASISHVNDQTAGSSDRSSPERQLSVVEAASRITVQDWHRYLGIVYETVLYEGIWVTFSCIVIATELHYHDPCAVMDLLGWICRDW